MRVNINVPEALNNELKQLKDDGAEINVSGICQECLRSEVSIRKASLLATDGRSKAIARLREERLGDQKEYFDLGVEEGGELASGLQYQDLLDLVNLNDGGFYDLDRIDEILHGYSASLKDVLYRGDDDHPSDFENARSGYVKGLCLVVSNFWADIKDEVLANE